MAVTVITVPLSPTSQSTIYCWPVESVNDWPLLAGQVGPTVALPLGVAGRPEDAVLGAVDKGTGAVPVGPTTGVELLFARIVDEGTTMTEPVPLDGDTVATGETITELLVLEPDTVKDAVELVELAGTVNVVTGATTAVPLELVGSSTTIVELLLVNAGPLDTPVPAEEDVPTAPAVLFADGDGEAEGAVTVANDKIVEV